MHKPGNSHDDRVTEARRAGPGPDAAPTYDDSGWPIFIVRLPPSPLSSQAFEAHLAACEQPYRRGTPFGMLVDLAEHPPMPASQRRAVALTIRDHEKRYPGLCRGDAIVVRSSIARGVMTAINWIAATVHPTAAFTSVEEARAWLEQQLRAGR